MKLEKYQIEGANFLAQNKHALLADDMGLGKTAQAIIGFGMTTKFNTLITKHNKEYVKKAPELSFLNN